MPARKPQLELAPDREPWAQQPGEGPIPFGHFRAYLSLGHPRPTWSDFARQRGVGVKTITQTAQAGLWAERVSAYDSSIVNEVRAEIVHVAKRDAFESAHRAQALADKMHKIADIELDKILRAAQTEHDVPVLTPKTLMHLIQMAVTLDRVLAPGENGLPVEGKPDLSRLSVTQLTELRRMAAIATGGQD